MTKRRGRSARVRDRAAAQAAGSGAGAGNFNRRIPPYEMVSDRILDAIHDQSLSILEDIGIEFRDEPALASWRDAGADVTGERVRISRDLLLDKIALAPSEYVQQARNADRAVTVGGDHMVISPVYGPPFVLDLDGTRRYARLEDLEAFIKLAYMLPALNHSGGPICEPVDVPVAARHLEITYAHMRWSDLPFMGAVTAGSRAEDCLAMCRILFGAEFVENNVVMTSLVNCNSPLVWDATMLEALRTYAAAGQAVIISPFLMQGASTPSTMAGVLAQNNAEALAAIAYAQLVRAGAPMVFGSSGTTVSMQTGAPMNATAEAQFLAYVGGAMGRRYGLPTRLGGMRTSSPTPDAQAAYESSQSMLAAVLAGGHFIVHSAGWLEGGLSACYAKFLMDADQAIILQRLAGGFEISEEAFAMDAFHEVGPGGQFFGCAHTQRHFEDIFFMPETSYFGTYEQWQAEGERDAAVRARNLVKQKLSQYEPPPLDPGIDEALRDFMARRRDELTV
jgi:trimethylamine---corrinoid protein Co-methyltransferase